MELKTAIEILEYHQKWTLGEREHAIYQPRFITEAINVILDKIKKNK